MQSPSNRLPEPLENVGIEWLRANSHASMTMLNSQSKRRRACACAAMSRIIRRLAKLADAQTAAQKAAAENLHASAPTAVSKTPATAAQVAGTKAEQKCSMDRLRAPTA